MYARLVFNPRAIYVGLYWTSAWEGPTRLLNLYFTPLPMISLLIVVKTGSAL